MGNGPGQSSGESGAVEEDDTQDVPRRVLQMVLERLRVEEATQAATVHPEALPLDESLDGPPPLMIDDAPPLWRPTAFFAGLLSFTTVLLGIVWWMLNGS